MAHKNVKTGKQPRDESGQSIVIMVFAFIALILIVGLAIDLGMIYIERIRLSRACDAAALAAASELPLEGEAQLRAIEALAHNGYDVTNALIRINGMPRPGSPSEARITIDINTVDYQKGGVTDTADKIRVRGISNVRMSIMQLIGISQAPVEWKAVAENVNNLDIALVLDRSGSMQEDTICLGCYERGSSIYPSGERYPLAWPKHVVPDPPDPDPWPNGPPPPCDPAEPIEGGGHLSLVMEAEFYDYTNRPYHREYNLLGDSYWALQRPTEDTGNCNGDRTCGSSSLDAGGGGERGAYMMHMPYSTMANTDGFGEVDGDTPRLDYRVEIPAAYHNNAFYVFVRGQGGGQWNDQVEPRLLYWGVDASSGPAIGQTNIGNFEWGGYNEPVVGPNDWRWGRLSGSVNLSQGVHTLHIWAGGIGFRLDKIILTTNYYFNPSDEGPDETHGRDPSGLACDPCNPGYGLRIEGQCDNRRDDLYDDDQPIRFLKEAAKDFAARLDPVVDQIGVVTYGRVEGSSKASIDSYLQCVEEHGDPCYFDDVMDAIEAMEADGGTNIPDGIRRGIEVFAHENSRGAAAHIMILMTDGQTNQCDGLAGYTENEWGTALTAPACAAGDPWPDNSGGNEPKWSRDCVVYYANQAREAGYVIYAISLGTQADMDLLEYVAEETGGQHYNTVDPEDLSAIFNSIADHIFLRLIE